MPARARPAGSTSWPAVDLAQRLISWQRRHGRHELPWQGTRDPYRVWLSEVMLQQTQVATVLPHYARFLHRFPDVQSLAAAELDEVLALWSGLGYYSRARHLHRAAQEVTGPLGGRFPDSAAALLALPGVGRSTAAAIAVFCFGERAAILDGNVKRVLARALGFDGDLALPREEQRLWQCAEALLPRQGIEAYTQGLMDLGSSVCLARQPRCEACPLQGTCVALAQGEPWRYPVKTRTLRRGQRRNAWLWLRWRGQLWLTQRPPRGVWASLWCLPEFTSLDSLHDTLHGQPGRGQPLPVIEHSLTHFDWTLEPLQWQLPARLSARGAAAVTAALPAGRWVAEADVLEMGIPTPLRRLIGG